MRIDILRRVTVMRMRFHLEVVSFENDFDFFFCEDKNVKTIHNQGHSSII